MFIYGLEKSSLLDYPNKISCIVFTAGCNFRCNFCHNLELVLPELIKKQPKIDETKFFNFLEKRKKLLDGVVITGGEPTIQPDLENFLKKIKDLGFLVKIDTNGTNPAKLQKLIDKNLVDYIAMDIKASLKVQSAKCKMQNRYEEIVKIQINLKIIKKSIEIIQRSKKEHEFRTTIIPGFHNKEEIIEIAKFVAPSKLFLQEFKNPDNKIPIKADPLFLKNLCQNLKEDNIQIRA